MSKTETVKIKAVWNGWNYAHGENGPYWLPEGDEILEARVTPKSFIVHYGAAGIRKLLPKFFRRSTNPKSKWSVHYGSHERCTRTKIVFTLVA